MNLLSFTDAENYIRNKQVFIVPEIADKYLKTQTKENTVYDIGEVEVTEIREDCICLTLQINKKEISIYLEKTNNIVTNPCKTIDLTNYSTYFDYNYVE